MLKHLTDESLIRLGIEATDWEDAIRQAAEPLKEQGKITQGYIDGIIRNMEEAGPYFVLAPHIALPHTRPEEGALQSAIGIATLKTPVAFGSESNDPVKFVLPQLHGQ
jgi:PTS system ascorbate-specific IIA component